MKRFFSSIVLVMMGLLQSNAQIPRQFLGYDLGSSQQEVLQGMKSKGYLIEDKEGGFSIFKTEDSPIMFEGYEWDAAVFEFSENGLYSVTFVFTSVRTPIKLILEIYQTLTKELGSKYNMYENEIINERAYLLHDYNTAFNCFYIYMDSNMESVDHPTDTIYMGLTCCDVKDFLKEKVANIEPNF